MNSLSKPRGFVKNTQTSKLTAIAGLIVFAFPFSNQSSAAAQLIANAGESKSLDSYTYDGVSDYGLYSDGAAAEINVTGTGSFNLTGGQSGFFAKNGGAINLTGGGTINSSGGNSSISMASVGTNGKLTIKDYQITVDSSLSTNGRHALRIENTLADNLISNTTINYTGSDKAALLYITASNITLNNNRFITDHSKGGTINILSQGSVLSTVNINGGHYESSNSVDGFNGNPSSGATIDLGGGSTLNIKNNAKVVASDDSNAIQLRSGILNAENTIIQGGTAGILSSIAGGYANLTNTDVSASQGAAVLVNTYNYIGQSPSISLNATNSNLSGKHGVRVENIGRISGVLDNATINAIDTAVSVDSTIAGKTGTITLDIKNGSTLNAANVFDAQNGGYLDLTLDHATATGTSRSIYSHDGSVNLAASASSVTGDMEQTGSGTTNAVFTNGSVFKGAATNIDTLTLHDDSIWQLTGTSSVTTLDNSSGAIAFTTPTNGFRSLDVAGNYTGGGSITFNTKLGDDSSLTDKLVIAGNTSGTTKVKVNNFGGTGGQTTNGIELINVQGVSDGEFKQDGRIVAGAYDYSLARGNSALGTDEKNWYLSSKLMRDSGDVTDDVIRPEAGSYLGLLEYNQSAFNHSFHDRQQLLDNQYQSAWARVEYSKAESKAANGQLKNETERTLIHFGADVLQQDKLHIGLMGGYAKGDIDTSSNLSNNTSSAKSDGYSAGVYGTWFDQDKNNGGLYVDTYAQYNWFKNKVNGKDLPEMSLDTNSYTISAEAGYGFILGKTGNTAWQVEPQVQVIYNNHEKKSGTEKNGTRISTNDSDDFVSRIGVRFQGKSETVEPFVTLNYWNHSQNAGISMNDTQINSERARNIFEVKAGGQISLNKNVDLFAQVSGSWGDHSTTSYGGNVGLQMKW